MTTDILRNIWPEWHIVKIIGSGSFGTVYEAVRTEHSVSGSAAIKVISIPKNKSEIDSLRSGGLSRDATRTYLRGVVDDFVNEIQLMESLKGIQNIVSIEDYKVVEKRDEIGWDIFIRMELLKPFASVICNEILPEKEVIKLGIDICTALELCTKCNVIHRDIKPQNIFINRFGDYKLGDFGIARKLENVTGGLSMKGSPNYMAPEVAKSGNYDSKVDIYSLGIVLYQLMNKNRLPFLETEEQLRNPNAHTIAINRRMDGEVLPAPSDASPVMAKIILCACSYNPNNRFASPTAMKKALLGIVNGKYSKSVVNNQNGSTSMQKRSGNCDETVTVRKASGKNSGQAEAVDTFGMESKKKLKKFFYGEW